MKGRAVAMKARAGDETLKAKTGRAWDEWFAVLEKAGARDMSHKEIAAHLYTKLNASGWWSQMIAVGYEQARGLRQKYQNPEGFEVSRSKTVAAPLAKLFRAWSDAKTRGRWLKDNHIEIRKATPNKTMRVTWSDRVTSLSVYFFPKGDGRSQVTVQHSKLKDAPAAERMKTYWAGALERLQGLLERP